MFINLSEISNLVCLEMLKRIKPNNAESALRLWIWNIKNDITANRFLSTYILDDSTEVSYYKKCKVDYLVVQYFDDKLTQGIAIYKFASEDSVKEYLSKQPDIQRIIVLNEGKTYRVEKATFNTLRLIETQSNNSKYSKILLDLDTIGDGYWRYVDILPCRSNISTILKSTRANNFT